MGISLVGSLDSAIATAITSLTIANAAASVGDVRVLKTKIKNSGISVSSVSGGNATTWTKVAGTNTDNGATVANHEIWIGTVANTNSSGKETITVTWSSSVAGINGALDCYTFTNGNAATVWTKDTSGYQDNPSSATITYPSMSAANAGELAAEWARVPGGSSYGTPGGTPSTGWSTTTDADGNPAIFNLNVGPGTVAPTQSTVASDSHCIGVLLIASLPGGGPIPFESQFGSFF